MPLLLAGLRAQPDDRSERSDAGYAVLDVPEARRSFVSGPVISLAMTRDGLLFVGSNRLAIYDGRGWERVDVPGAIRVIALAADPHGPDRMWFGGEGALGFVERLRTGRWQCVSLNAHLAAAGIAGADDVRQILPDGRGGAWFVARAKVLHWDGTRFTAWDLPNPNRLWSFVHRGVLHVHQVGVGVWRLLAAGPELWLRETDLPVGQPLISLVDTPDGGQLAVFYEDMYRHRAGQWERLPEIAALLRGRRAMHVERADVDMIAVGTAYGGIFLLRNDGSLAGVVNGQNGLADDNVDALLRDGEGALWIGTGTGLARLSGTGRVSQFDQRARISHGFVRRVVAHRGRPFVITSRRAYELVPSAPTEPAHFLRLDTLWPQLREGLVFRDELWLGGTGGLWRVEDQRAVREPASTGDVFLLTRPARLPGALIYFERTRALAWWPGGEARPVALGGELESLPVAGAEDGAGNLWVATRNGIVHGFAVESDPPRLRPLARFAAGRGLPADTQRPVPATLGGDVFVFSDQAILRLRADGDGFEPVPELADFVAEAAVPLPDGAALWSVQHRALGTSAPHGLLRITRGSDGRLAAEPLQAPGLDHIGDVASLSHTVTDTGEAIWVGGENALLRLEPRALRPAPAPPAVTLRALRDGAEVPLPRHGRTEFPAATGRLEFSYAVPAGESAGLLFQTRLAGVEEAWSPATANPRREFTGLASGHYGMEVRAVDRFGRPGPVTGFTFAIAAPWYRTVPALAGWGALALLFLGAILRWRFRQLRLQTERLNKLVHERTRELSLSNTAKSELLESLSHEIRRPLNGIVSLIDRLDHAGLSPGQLEHARLLRRASESLSRTFDELLNFSQLDYGVLQVDARAFQVHEVIERVLGDHAADRRPPAIHYAPDFTDGFWGDELKLETMIGNFVANALKYAGDAAVEIHVSTSPSPLEGVVDLLVEVSDGGPGVPEEEQEVIFKRFVRGSLAKQSGLPGTGIGLATCRGMARMLGGNVGVESPSERARERGWPGPGATFFVRLPLRRQPAPAPESRAAV